MTRPDLETMYEALAQAIDAVGPDQAALYLAKVALALAAELDDAARALAVIDRCLTGLVAPVQPTVRDGAAEGCAHGTAAPS
jgi:hypothetical protein